MTLSAAIRLERRTHTRAVRCVVSERISRIYGHTHGYMGTRTLMQRQNKFAYACDRVRTEPRDGKRVGGWGGNSDGTYPQARTGNGTHIGVQPLESNVTKREEGEILWSSCDLVTREAADRIMALKK